MNRNFGLMLSLATALAISGGGALVGCRDNTPPPPNVPVPTADNPDAVRTSDPVKPLPKQSRNVEQD